MRRAGLLGLVSLALCVLAAVAELKCRAAAPVAARESVDSALQDRTFALLSASRHYDVQVRGLTRTVTFYGLQLEERPQEKTAASAGESFTQTLVLGGTRVLDSEGVTATLKEARAFRDCPGEGQATLLWRQYSGGAHCCSTYFFATTLPGGGVLVAETELGHGWWPAETEAELTYPLEFVDTSLASYPRLSLCFACSQRFTRYLVFDAKGWRVDRAGELSHKYRAQLAGVETALQSHLADPVRHDAEETARRLYAEQLVVLLMERAHCALMAGDFEEAVRERFFEEFPVYFEGLGEGVFDDVRAQVQSFNPVTQRLYR